MTACLRTLLHHDAAHGHIWKVETLLNHGAEPNFRDELNRTPLLMNCSMKDDCDEVTKLLVSAGADTTVKHQGKTDLEIAKDKKNVKIVEVLERG